MDCGPPGSLVHGIFQAWILEWVAISFSRGSSGPRDQNQVSRNVCGRFTIWATREAYVYISQVALVVKNPLANARDIRDTGLIPESGRSPGRGHGNPLQYSCLENLTDREAWRAKVHRFAKSRTWLKRLSTHACMHVYTHTNTHTYIIMTDSHDSHCCMTETNTKL